MYEGGCLCHKTNYLASGEPQNPHLCSCTMCQKSSGAPTVAWVSFFLHAFQWSGVKPATYQSSVTTLRYFCKQCGCLLAAFDEGSDSICITIASLENPNLIRPNQTHSYKESAPLWWQPKMFTDEKPR